MVPPKFNTNWFNFYFDYYKFNKLKISLKANAYNKNLLIIKNRLKLKKVLHPKQDEIPQSRYTTYVYALSDTDNYS